MSPLPCRFLMTSYLRLRLSKIQSQIWTLDFDAELLSREELTFAKSYRGASTCDARKKEEIKFCTQTLLINTLETAYEESICHRG